MLKVGEKIKFGKRSGTVRAHTAFQRSGEVSVYYIVELTPESSGYLEPIGDEKEKDTYISMMLVHVGNED